MATKTHPRRAPPEVPSASAPMLDDESDIPKASAPSISNIPETNVADTRGLEPFESCCSIQLKVSNPSLDIPKDKDFKLAFAKNIEFVPIDRISGEYRSNKWNKAKQIITFGKRNLKIRVDLMMNGHLILQIKKHAQGDDMFEVLNSFTGEIVGKLQMKDKKKVKIFKGALGKMINFGKIKRKIDLVD